MTDLILIGAGGHARVVIEILKRARQTIVAAVDANPKLHGINLDGVPVIGGDEKILDRKPTDVMLINAVGNVGLAIGQSGLSVRRGLFERFTAQGYRFGSVISPDATVASTAHLDHGCHIITGAILHPGAKVGANTIINTGAQLDHDCIVGAHCHIAPGVIFSGAVTVGDNVHVGVGAAVVQGIRIGSNAVIGAGAVVTADVPAGITVLGCPARPVERRP